MFSPYVCALASKLAYKEKDYSVIKALQHCPNWTFLRRSVLNNKDYEAIAVINVESKQIVIAHRGTVSSLVKNIYSDIFIFKAKRPLEYNFALRFSEQLRQGYPDYSFIETGHSLGAYYAELNAVHFNCKAITFDSPGTLDVFEKEGLDTTNADITTYLTAPNPVNTCNRHVGKIIRLFVHHVNKKGISFEDVGIGLNFLWNLRKLASLDVLPFLSDSTQIILEGLGGDLVSYYLRQHSIDLILDSFDSEIGHPYLQVRMMSWPKRSDFINWLFNSYFERCVSILPKLKYADSINENIDSEKLLYLLLNYTPAEFIVPSDIISLSNHNPKKINYSYKALLHFDEFYEYHEMISSRNILSNKLDFFRNRLVNFSIEEDFAMSTEKVKVVAGTTVVGGVIGGGYAWYTGATTLATICPPVGIGLAAGVVTGGVITIASDYINQGTIQENNRLRTQIQNLNTQTQQTQNNLNQMQGQIVNLKNQLIVSLQQRLISARNQQLNTISQNILNLQNSVGQIQNTLQQLVPNAGNQQLRQLFIQILQIQHDNSQLQRDLNALSSEVNQIQQGFQQELQIIQQPQYNGQQPFQHLQQTIQQELNTIPQVLNSIAGLNQQNNQHLQNIQTLIQQHQQLEQQVQQQTQQQMQQMQQQMQQMQNQIQQIQQVPSSTTTNSFIHAGNVRNGPGFFDNANQQPNVQNIGNRGIRQNQNTSIMH